MSVNKARLAVWKTLDQTESGFLQLLSDLVEAQATIGNEGSAQHIFRQSLTTIPGIVVDSFEVDPSTLRSVPGWSETKQDYRGRPNVVARLPGFERSRSLILNAHVDSVPPGPGDDWISDPWTPMVRDGRMHGRGVFDDKAGVAMMSWLVQAVVDAGIELRGDLILESVIEEEASGNGTLACSARGYNADAAIVLDGLGGGRAVTAHLGQISFRVGVEGRGAAAVETDGENAIELLLSVIEELRDFASEWSPPMPSPFHDLEQGCIFNPAVLMGGHSVSSVPTRAELLAHMTVPPRVSAVEMKQKIRDVVTNSGNRSLWLRNHPPQIDFLPLQMEAFIAPDEPMFLASLTQAQMSATGTRPTFSAISGFSDLRHFQLNTATPCCLYGPGVGGNAHAPNEWLDLSSVRTSARVISTFILDWCGIR